MLIRPRAYTRLYEPPRFDVELETVTFRRGVVSTTEKSEVDLFVDEEDVGALFIRDDFAAVTLRVRVELDWIGLDFGLDGSVSTGEGDLDVPRRLA